MAAYYNEIDPYAAQWLRNLIDAGHIAAGDVDERSILDVSPDDLAGYTQCHFFAGIGVWSYALRSAGWPDDRPVWTGSCPCQPFSVAGVGGGFDDERHLWPFWHFLIEQRRPPVVFGEQVEAAIKHGWLDLVQADMEGINYAFGTVDTPAAGVGAPHIRQRLYFVAHHHHQGLEGRLGMPERGAQLVAGPGGVVGELAIPNCAGLLKRERHDSPAGYGHPTTATSGDDRSEQPGPVNGFWGTADWLQCRDGKWRPVEPGTFPLVDGSAASLGRVRTDQERIAEVSPRKDRGSRSGRLRAYGNAIVAEVATQFIAAYMECQP